MKMEVIEITTEYVTLGQLIKLANLVATGGEAKNVIKDGNIYVNDKLTDKRGKKIYPGDKVKIDFVEEIVLKVVKC